MGIAGSMVNPDFFEEYLGMRCEYKDMSEIIRRVENEIYDKEEFERALAWTRENCKENDDLYNGENGHSREKKDAEWEYCVKMAMIVRDMMQEMKS